MTALPHIRSALTRDLWREWGWDRPPGEIQARRAGRKLIRLERVFWWLLELKAAHENQKVSNLVLSQRASARARQRSLAAHLRVVAANFVFEQHTAAADALLGTKGDDDDGVQSS